MNAAAKPKILFVGMQDSVHCARYLAQLTEQNFDLHFFGVYLAPTHPQMPPEVKLHVPFWHRFLPRATLSDGPQIATKIIAKPWKSWLLRLYPLVAPLVHLFKVPVTAQPSSGAFLYGPRPLKKLIRKLQPDIICSLNLQRGGYVALAVKEQLGEAFPRWVLCNWGSDLYYYRHFPAHAALLARLLQAADVYHSESERDNQLAREMGFTGEIWPASPIAGGYDMAALAVLRREPPSRCRVIAVKGYQHRYGRALVTLKALEQVRDYLAGYRIVVHSVSPETADEIARLQGLGLAIEILPASSHAALLALHASARISIGTSISDGISTSFLEAFAAGSFPIQSDTSTAGEWILHGKHGFLTKAEDPAAIAECLRAALLDDALVDAASLRNREVALARLEKDLLRQQRVDCYRALLHKIQT